ncbi:hypothetical protein CEUSTIGMA_g223.t1 [Chlamydomonas eustigma]|uniref:RRM domain-containing protein n=1 Tax=Chlamydomonas eustigma TaxID=1157962 RepID=A0A250WPJ6_9CHLO|nr:hypothetical protein CEUSTIGMA_g223.t1 [Chlamydomonas eustigma]|eukprot:GAX72767.1 hypothetical protein CEUSTIGMA_g223.t1 [Chlamydomonas eustigma]
MDLQEPSKKKRNVIATDATVDLELLERLGIGEGTNTGPDRSDETTNQSKILENRQDGRINESKERSEQRSFLKPVTQPAKCGIQASQIEVFLGGLSKDISEGDIIASLSDSGLPVLSVKIQREFEGTQSRGFAYITFPNMYTAQKACHSISKIGGRPVALHITRSKTVEHLGRRPDMTPYRVVTAGGESHLSLLLNKVRSLERPVAGVSEAMASAYASKVLCEDVLNPLSIKLPESAAKRQAVGHQRKGKIGSPASACATSSEASVPYPPLRISSVHRPIMNNDLASIDGPVFKVQDHGLQNRVSVKAHMQGGITPEKVPVTEAPEPSVLTLAHVLHNYPETQRALHEYQESKPDIDVQSLTPLTILNQCANRLRVEVSYSESADTPTGPFLIQARMQLPKDFENLDPLCGSGKARLKKDAKQLAAAGILEQLLPVIRGHQGRTDSSNSTTPATISSGNRRKNAKKASGNVKETNVSHTLMDGEVSSAVPHNFYTTHQKSSQARTSSNVAVEDTIANTTQQIPKGLSSLLDGFPPAWKNPVVAGQEIVSQHPSSNPQSGLSLGSPYVGRGLDAGSKQPDPLNVIGPITKHHAANRQGHLHKGVERDRHLQILGTASRIASHVYGVALPHTRPVERDLMSDVSWYRSDAVLRLHNQPAFQKKDLGIQWKPLTIWSEGTSAVLSNIQRKRQLEEQQQQQQHDLLASQLPDSLDLAVGSMQSVAPSGASRVWHGSGANRWEGVPPEQVMQLQLQLEQQSIDGSCPPGSSDPNWSENLNHRPEPQRRLLHLSGSPRTVTAPVGNREVAAQWQGMFELRHVSHGSEPSAVFGAQEAQVVPMNVHVGSGWGAEASHKSGASAVLPSTLLDQSVSNQEICVQDVLDDVQKLLLGAGIVKGPPSSPVTYK